MFGSVIDSKVGNTTRLYCKRHFVIQELSTLCTCRWCYLFSLILRNDRWNGITIDLKINFYRNLLNCSSNRTFSPLFSIIQLQSFLRKLNAYLLLTSLNTQSSLTIFIHFKLRKKCSEIRRTINQNNETFHGCWEGLFDNFGRHTVFVPFKYDIFM